MGTVKSVKDVSDTALTILMGFTPRELAHRVIKNREVYERALRRDGQHFPSQDQMNREFKLPASITEEEARQITLKVREDLDRQQEDEQKRAERAAA